MIYCWATLYPNTEVTKPILEDCKHITYHILISPTVMLKETEEHMNYCIVAQGELLEHHLFCFVFPWRCLMDSVWMLLILIECESWYTSKAFLVKIIISYLPFFTVCLHRWHCQKDERLCSLYTEWTGTGSSEWLIRITRLDCSWTSLFYVQSRMCSLC